MAENSKTRKSVNSSEFSASGKLEDRETRGGKLEAGNSTITHLLDRVRYICNLNVKVIERWPMREWCSFYFVNTYINK